VMPTAPLRASVRLVEGLLAAGTGDHEEACDRFEDAVDLFTGCRAPAEAARARLELSAALAALGRTDAAEREARGSDMPGEGWRAGRQPSDAGSSQDPGHERGGDTARPGPAVERSPAAGAPPSGRWVGRQGHRGQARPQRAHRSPPCRQHLPEARMLITCGRRRAREPPRPALARSPGMARTGHAAPAPRLAAAGEDGQIPLARR
jgi:hypothetical protein